MPLKPRYDLLPEHIQGGVRRYLEDGTLPGSFLQAVICNNLKESFMYADEINIARMFDIAKFFYNEAPMGCQGSKETMIFWHYSRMFKPGTQIIYVPNHVEDENDPRCEQGFVTSVSTKGAFCRYWSENEPGALRTSANSELTPFDCLCIKNTHIQGEVDTMVAGIEKEEEDERKRRNSV